MKLGIMLALVRNVSIQKVIKGEILIPVGSTDNNVFFIRKGLVRSYMINEKAEEITFQLYPEYSLFGNVHSVLLNEPSKFSYQALENCKVYMVDYNSYRGMVAKNPQLLEISQTYLGRNVLKSAFQRIESFVFLSPEERYKKFAKNHPNVIERTPDKYIANVLGITPVSLSRIRNRIASQK